jgi:hypothetical protein
MRLVLRLVPAIGLLLAASPLVLGGAGRGVTLGSYIEHVRFLASDELGGRGNGTEGLRKAGDYVAAQMKEAGLEPGGLEGSWFQPFEIATGLTAGAGNLLTLHAGAQSIALQLGSSYYPLAATPTESPGEASASINGAPLVFAGHGISAKKLGYDDYAGIDVRGKAVVVFTHEPQENDPQSTFNGTQMTHHATLMEKAMTARTKGAVALLIVADPTHEQDSGTYEAFGKDPQAEDYGIPVLRMDRARVEPLLSAWGLPALAREIDRDLAPRSRELPEATIDYAEHLVKTRRTVRNVVGVLPGSDSTLAREAVVIGAHYDHLGRGGRHSLSPELAGQIHNGADDNASGTAAVLELAWAAAADRDRFPRTLVFVTFAGEELGLLGSSHYVGHPTIPLEQTVAMINLDMVGRAQGKVVVSGLDTSPSLKADLDAAAEGGGIEVKQFQVGAGVGASDDTSFVLKKIPAIGFFSGFHSDYHRPTDDWQKIDAPGAVQVTSIVLELAARIANRTDRPEFMPPPPSHGPSSTSGGSGATGGYGPYFGSVPDFADSADGMRIADVRENGPAWTGGIRGGDVMVEFAGTPITSLVDFTFALRGSKPGDEVEVKVLRNGMPLTATVTLTTRP